MRFVDLVFGWLVVIIVRLYSRLEHKTAESGHSSANPALVICLPCVIEELFRLCAVVVHLRL